MTIDCTKRWLASALGLVVAVGIWGCGQRSGRAPQKSQVAAMEPARRPVAAPPEIPPARKAAKVPEAMRPAMAKPAPYPQKWITEARDKHRTLRCYRLVYKRGCSVVRRGRLTVQVTLAADGKVTSVKGLTNTVRVDPKLMLRCVQTELAKWRFTPPKGVTPRFTMQFVFRDRC